MPQQTTDISTRRSEALENLVEELGADFFITQSSGPIEHDTHIWECAETAEVQFDSDEHGVFAFVKFYGPDRDTELSFAVDEKTAAMMADFFDDLQMELQGCKEE